MKELRLRYYGDPVLRKKTKLIKEVSDEVRELIDGMIKIMIETEGIGLAGPQVGVSLRLFVTNVGGQNEDGSVIYTDPYAVLNPMITQLSEEETEMEEGCLSIPELYVPVMRPLKVHLNAMDSEGKPIDKDIEGFLARVYMHETDHLDGVLTVDHLKGKKRSDVEPALRLIKQKYR